MAIKLEVMCDEEVSMQKVEDYLMGMEGKVGVYRYDGTEGGSRWIGLAFRLFRQQLSECSMSGLYHRAISIPR